MPELPEVETVCRGLLPHMEGARIKGLTPRRAGLRVPFPEDMADRFNDLRVLSLRRRAKYILMENEAGAVMILHLGMSGRIRIDMRDTTWPQLEKHDHLVWETDRGARVVFNDARRFGMVLCADRQTLAEHPLLAELGPEPLGNEFHPEHLSAAFAARRSPLKSALMDQHVVAGLGNIYVCEALFRAGLSPRRRADTVGIKRINRLYESIRQVLTDAIDAGGSTLKDHKQVSGDLGYFQHRFQVYGREDKPCVKPGCKGQIKRIVQSGRSSFYCSFCQR